MRKLKIDDDDDGAAGGRPMPPAVEPAHPRVALSLPPPALPRPLAGAELYVSSYEFVARAFSEFKITRS